MEFEGGGLAGGRVPPEGPLLAMLFPPPKETPEILDFCVQAAKTISGKMNQKFLKNTQLPQPINFRTITN
jgi:hypothetical protein